MLVFYCRIFQKVLKFFTDLAPFWRKPEVLHGADSMDKLPGLLSGRQIHQVLLVTDPSIAKLKLHQKLIDILSDNNIGCTVFDKTVVNPTIGNIEEAYCLYKKERCHAIIGFGGGYHY